MNGHWKKWVAGIASALVIAFFLALGNFMYQVSIFMNRGDRFTRNDGVELHQQIEDRFVTKSELILQLQIMNLKLDNIAKDVDELCKQHEKVVNGGQG